MTDWQPIETAPKDGTRVLLWPYLDYVSSPPESVAVAGRWYNRIGWVMDPNEATEYDFQSMEATHWMPLPEPPK